MTILHGDVALEHIARADDWANRDSVRDPAFREKTVNYNLQLALIHAVLAVAQQVNYLTAKGGD